jgi:hypothetical protein
MSNLVASSDGIVFRFLKLVVLHVPVAEKFLERESESMFLPARKRYLWCLLSRPRLGIVHVGELAMRAVIVPVDQFRANCVCGINKSRQPFKQSKETNLQLQR